MTFPLRKRVVSHTASFPTEPPGLPEAQCCHPWTSSRCHLLLVLSRLAGLVTLSTELTRHPSIKSLQIEGFSWKGLSEIQSNRPASSGLPKYTACYWGHHPHTPQHWQAQGTNHLSRQPVPVPDRPHGEHFSSCSPRTSPAQLGAAPAMGDQEQGPVPPPQGGAEPWGRLSASSSPARSAAVSPGSPHRTCLWPSYQLVALFWTLSGTLTPFL